jgi:hypothetical protein
MHIVALLLASKLLLAQTETPPKIDNTDLRESFRLFSVQDISKEKTYILERTGEYQHYLKLVNDDEDPILRKVDGRDAKKLDLDFASRFIKLQYGLGENPDKCSAAYKLTMKGEEQVICEKDDKKTQELAGFLAELGKRFQ